MFSKYLTPLFPPEAKKKKGPCSSKKLVEESWFSWLQARESDPLLEGYQRQGLKTWEMSRNQENQLLGTAEKVTKATYVPAIGPIVITSICDLYMSQYCMTSYIPQVPAPVTQESEFLEKEWGWPSAGHALTPSLSEMESHSFNFCSGEQWGLP